MAKKKGVKKWLKDTVAMATVAFSNVEKDMLGQKATPITNDVTHVRRNTQGSLMDALVNGEITQEVKELRWRTYMVTKAMSGHKVEFMGEDENGEPIYRVRKNNVRQELNDVKVDYADGYDVEMVFTPKEITTGIYDMLDNKYIDEYDEPEVTMQPTNEIIKDLDESKPEDEKDEYSPAESKALAIRDLGTIKGKDFYASNKSQLPIVITRRGFPKFYLERYAKKLVVRNIDGDNKLLELYVSKYPIEEEKNSVLFVNEIKKISENAFGKNTVEIDAIEFVTEDTLGADDMMKYSYQIVKFDKVVEFAGHYVIKFLAKVVINGEDLFEKFRLAELDEKYSKKECRKNQFSK